MATETFNLAPPPGFRGLDPHLPITVYHRHLPHWRQAGATYFATFRLGDSLPKEKLDYLNRLREEWERTHPQPRSKTDLESFAREVFSHVETSLDEGHGLCYFREPPLAAVLEEALLHFQDERYLVGCWAIMPNHCHLVMRPFGNWPLEKTLQGIKGVVARRVNKVIGAKGPMWQEESYDRIVRDEEHLWRVVQYIGRNPKKAGLPRQGWRRWIHPTWEAAGWWFVDE
jgi:putative transposase